MTAWQKHVQRWENCRRCRLCDQRSSIVLCRGTLPCDVLFVGEAPGQSEDVVGLPFVGPAGRLLDEIVEEALGGLVVGTDENGDDVALTWAFTNLVACYPRKAKKAGTNEPETDEIKACAGRLRELVRMARPALIVCVGKLAKRFIMGQAQFCLPGENNQPPWIAEGRFMRFAEIVHPAAILRAPLAQQDMMKRRSVVVLSNAVEDI